MRDAMDCTRFDRRLDALLEGSCTAAEWQEAEAHAGACPRCRSLLDAMAGLGNAQDEAAAEALAGAVLARTSGAACDTARDRLADLVDGELTGIDRELVEGHLGRCEACAALAGAMAQATALLPGFAELRPPADLTPAVLAATSRRPAPPSFDERLAAWLARLASRPRISLEAAYLCTLLIFLAVGNPVAAVRETSAKGRELAQPRVELLLERVASGPAGWVREVRAAVAERAAASSAGRAEAGLASRVSGMMASAWRWIGEHLASLDAAFEHIVGWVSGLVRTNPSGAGRVYEAEGTREGTQGSGGR